MKFIKSIHAVDSHTAGEATRVVVGGVPKIPGKNMPEKKQWLEDNLDYLRTAIMLEPRGHKDMFGSILTQPTVDEADYGIIFMDGGGYLNMCGHGSRNGACDEGSAGSTCRPDSRTGLCRRRESEESQLHECSRFLIQERSGSGASGLWQDSFRHLFRRFFLRYREGGAGWFGDRSGECGKVTGLRHPAS